MTLMQLGLFIGALLYFIPILKMDGKKDRLEMLLRAVIILLFLIAFQLESFK